MQTDSTLSIRLMIIECTAVIKHLNKSKTLEEIYMYKLL